MEVFNLLHGCSASSAHATGQQLADIGGIVRSMPPRPYQIHPLSRRSAASTILLPLSLFGATGVWTARVVRLVHRWKSLTFSKKKRLHLMSSLHTRGHHGIHDDIGTNMTMVAMLMMPQDLAGKPCHSSECSRRRRCSTEHRRRPRASVPAHPCSDNHASADDYLTRTRPQPCRRSRRCDLARELRHLTKQRVSRRRLKLAPTCQYDSQPTNQLTN
jgi:hypothetical protein